MSSKDFSFSKQVLETGIVLLNIGGKHAGDLFFSNGNLWAVYISEKQALDLIEVATELNLKVQGEEGEVYFIGTGGDLEWRSSVSNRNALFNFFKRHSLSMLIIFIFAVAALLID